MDVAKDAQTLLALLENPKLDQDSAFKILDQHMECFKSSLCPICQYLDEESLGSILLKLARHSNAKEIQKRSLNESHQWQGAEIGVKLALARNPALDSQLRPSLLHAEIWYGYGYGHELISDLIEAAAGNPNFPEDEIEEFEDECVEYYDYQK